MNAGTDQSKKQSAAPGLEFPSQMGLTASAEDDLPGMPGKPCEFGRWGTGRDTADRVTIAGDLENNAIWIGERMLMGSVNRRAFVGFADSVIALAA
jgi:hypothetical protein